jgi:peptidoglycan/xylan/chitin deacetylase (PgdA/CDA1 family)
MQPERDLIGFADHPPNFDWPGGARVAVNFVLNVEEGSEYSILDGDGRTDSALSEVAAARVPRGDRDLGYEGMVEFGSRVGVWRILRLFRDRGLPMTIFAAAQALERHPPLAAAIAESDWDVVCHGWRWAEHYLMDEATERDHIARAYDSITALTGRAPEGWYCRYAPSVNTRRLVVEHGGFGYDSDSYADEIPFWVKVGERDHLVVPYSLVTNDTKFLGGPLVTGRDWGAFLIDTIEGLLAEAPLHPRMMSVGMHPRILGHPGRLKGLIDFMDHIAADRRICVCTRAQIAAHFRAHVPAPSSRVPA